MKKAFLFTGLILAQFAFGQNVILNNVLKTSENTDKFLYRINADQSSAEYLGELEVQGFSNDDVDVFNKIYKKAKEIGANAFSFQPFIDVDGSLKKFDPANYKLSLYYLPQNNFPKENNTVYIISASTKSQKISYNKDIIEFHPRTYTRKILDNGEIYTISTRKFLGSSIKLAAKIDQPVQYFQLSAAQIRTNPYGSAGITLKSGDITMLEKSYGDFLITIYQEFQ